MCVECTNGFFGVVLYLGGKLTHTACSHADVTCQLFVLLLPSASAKDPAYSRAKTVLAEAYQKQGLAVRLYAAGSPKWNEHKRGNEGLRSLCLCFGCEPFSPQSGKLLLNFPGAVD